MATKYLCRIIIRFEVSTLSLEIENNDYNKDEVYNQNLLDDLLKQDDIDRFREEFLAMHEYEQSEYFEDTSNENRQKIFEFLSPQEVGNSLNN